MVIVFSLIAGGSLAAYCMLWVASNTVHVDMRYTIVLSSSASRRNVLVRAAVRYDGRPVGAGINVDFYYSFNGGNMTFFATQPTNSAGVAQTRYTITAYGEYDFEARVRIV